MTTEYDIFTRLRYEICQDLSPSQFEKAKSVLLEVSILEDAGLIETTPCMACEQHAK